MSENLPKPYQQALKEIPIAIYEMPYWLSSALNTSMAIAYNFLYLNTYLSYEWNWKHAALSSSLYIASAIADRLSTIRGLKAAQAVEATGLPTPAKEANMVFITAGMGGGTGSGSAPIIAGVAKEIGALTVAVVTKPFMFEGARRMSIAEEAIDQLKDKVDALIVIPNQRILDVVGRDTSILEAFKIVVVDTGAVKSYAEHWNDYLVMVSGMA